MKCKISYNVQDILTVTKQENLLLFMPSFSNNLLIQIACLKACVATMYSASIVDRAIIVWNFET